MTNARSHAHRFRRLLLIGAILFWAAAIFWAVLPLSPGVSEALFGEHWFPAGLVGTPLQLVDTDYEWLYGVNVALVVGLLLLAQWAFLRPGRGLSVRLAETGRPLRLAVIAAAAMAVLLTAGLVALLAELAAPDDEWWLKPVLGPVYGWLGLNPEPESAWVLPCFWAAVLLPLWAVWTWVFFVYWRQGDRYTQLGRMLRALIGGSLLEAFVAVPAHVFAVRQRECYCTRGTYTTLVLAAGILFWAFGPGIILLYMREKYRRAVLFPTCEKCGHDLRGNASNACPECGVEIKNAWSGCWS